MASYFFDDDEVRLLRKGGSAVPVADALHGLDYVLVYFSAHWCPPCRGFTSVLKAFYDAHHTNKKFTVVFVSLDHTEADMMSYFVQRHGDYYCLPYKQAQPTATRWGALYGFENVPTLLVFANTDPRRIVSKRGHVMLRGDPEGERFPWRQTAAAPTASHV